MVSHLMAMPKKRYILLLLCFGGVSSFLLLQNKSFLKTPEYEPGDIETTVHCKSNLVDRRHVVPPAAADTSTIYVVTPTYRRVEQVAELTRQGQTLLTVPDIVWMVVEDADACSPVVAALLDRFGIPYVHLASAMPARYRGLSILPRGVSNRRAALKWLRAASPLGVMYFLDDDNTVDIRLFEQIRHTQKVSMFPVGLMEQFLVSSPVIREGKVTGFFDSWPAGRQFAVDMAGFALNLRVVLASSGTMPYHPGYEEDKLLQNLNVNVHDIEPLANLCTEVLVWHTKTKKHKPTNLLAEVRRYENSNIGSLYEHMQATAMAVA
ncbi:galactosylgalactosylxylosylprotein 3-beta-glucuronosyltransferase S-like [Pollicipes pollicipes]|uniref:galactosylgalactosylxylosylprotein 3-beta-glucuronosyltransferase S-like n=1 Tax=Pollicipes pollicipes TaxID=41117 RepID=UPI001884DFD9|nr:galactosylgalactosylxylosylprotein 3-beta-glucuronosyltransferase S-like [Pollicipes pollicipes]XP_037087087.1 galactosylgalactosylxylosylprotein 3-beta-glucuronosyltransferase S-like [Pollicipes pollicipes]XP_037087088.1 galactosylgalactosylxylosylprotein 3-beta-glucuronosyltransferase S-like [Pollicipes pollicipes]